MNDAMKAANKRIVDVIVNIVMLAFSIFCIFPFIWMFYSSFKTEAEFAQNIIALPKSLQFSNYAKAIQTGKLGFYSINSLFNCIITVTVVVVIAFIAAYFLSRFSFKGRNLIYGLFMLGMLIPVHSLMIPIFMQFKALNFLDTRLTLLPVYISFGLPMAIFLMESFIGGIPVDLEEAATIDGSSMLRSMFSVIMPLCKPVIATVVILTFMGTWNEFPFALILVKTDALKTIPVGLRNFQGAYTARYAQFMAGMIVALIPVIIVYALFYKKIIVGMTAGSVKG
ncbi:MAG TPA: carbohydrate ABC transporter permease [Ruminiclostridium sp.]